MRIITLLGFLVAAGLVSLVGSMAGIGDWYDGLRKPLWNPPGWVFGPVWAVLYLMMAVAAWQVWELSLIHISEPTRPPLLSRMPSSA